MSKPVAAFLSEVRNALDEFMDQGVGRQVEVPALDPAGLALLEETLGEGEVSGEAENGAVHIRESKYPGLWRVRRFEGDAVVADGIEIGLIPRLVAESSRIGAAAEPPELEPSFGIMNAPPVLQEIRDRLRNFRPGERPYGINLTQMPLSPQDVHFIDRSLGTGSVALLSQGGFDCRILSTGVANLWRVQYFNVGDSLILDTIEITEVPEAALTAQEEMLQTSAALGEALRWLAS